MVEICCGSYEDAICAYKGGAKRIELNSALYLGGLTPTTASLILTKAQTNLEIICMVRVRGAGFCYSELEVEQMNLEAKELLEHGADGIAFGFLNENRTIDAKKTKKMVELIHSYGKTAVFHRAFDCVSDAESSIKLLISLGIDRVLTSGLHEKALDGKDIIKELQRDYGTQIEILPGSGINETNVKELVNYTGVSQVHSSCRGCKKDKTTSGTRVSFSYSEKVDMFDGVKQKLVENIIKAY